MTLLEKIKNDINEARRNGEKDRVISLNMLLSDAKKISKEKANREPTDEEIISVAKKRVSSCSETIADLEERDNIQNEFYKNIQFEKMIFEQYIPVQMSENEIKDAIEHLISSAEEEKNMKLMSKIMKKMKEQYGSSFNGKIASKIAKELLK